MQAQAAHHGTYFDTDAGVNDRQQSMLVHLLGLLGIADGMGIISFIIVVVLWRTQRASPFIDDHGREATNFQISLFAYALLGAIVLAILTLATLGLGIIFTLPIGLLGLLALLVLRLVGCIRGAMAAHRGEYYRYPMTIRFIPEPRY